VSLNDKLYLELSHNFFDIEQRNGNIKRGYLYYLKAR